MPEIQILTYILIATDNKPISEKQFELFIKDITKHAEKHDFAQMIQLSEICIGNFTVKNIEYEGIFIPFHKDRFEDLTTLNWYLKTQSAKHHLMMFQLKMPDGSFIGM